ncbi:MAG: tetratricopeptide repeat protein, partial [Longimicrobiales bacterium]
MSDSVDQEIRALESIHGSERDPEGLAFAPLADAFRRKGDIRKAFDLLQDGTARHPDFATGHVVTAQLYVDWGFPAEAELAARRVLELDSENIVALSILGSILDERGDDEAGAVHDVLVGADPESEQARAVTKPLDEALGLPSHAMQGIDSLDMLGVHEAEARVEDPAAFEVADAPEMDPFDLAMDIEPVVEEESEIEEVMDLGALAPEPEPIVEDVMDLGALAPEPEP